MRHIFHTYLELKSIPKLADHIAWQGIRTRKRTLKNGRTIGGVCFGTGPLALLLKNPVYVGNIRHKDQIYGGEHQAVIDEDIFEEVQATLKKNRLDKTPSKRAKNPSLLAGMISDPDGKKMSPAAGKKGSKRYSYYVTRQGPNEDNAAKWRPPAGEIDRLVVNAIARNLQSDNKSEESCPDKLAKKTQTIHELGYNPS